CGRSSILIWILYIESGPTPFVHSSLCCPSVVIFFTHVRQVPSYCLGHKETSAHRRGCLRSLGRESKEASRRTKRSKTTSVYRTDFLTKL
uniref:Uncharacterized protein n=1 Tax=Seriola dumerili TaxID=41447 RepID=A0A3B4UFW8_SERDU